VDLARFYKRNLKLKSREVGGEIGTISRGINRRLSSLYYLRPSFEAKVDLGFGGGEERNSASWGLTDRDC